MRFAAARPGRIGRAVESPAPALPPTGSRRSKPRTTANASPRSLRTVPGSPSALSPDFIAVDLDRDQEKAADVVAAIVTPPQSTIVQTCKYVIRGLQTDGAITTVLETQTSTGSLLNDAVMKPFVRVQDSTDVWKFSGRPLEIASQWTGVRLTVDGDVVQDRGILASPQP